MSGQENSELFQNQGQQPGDLELHHWSCLNSNAFMPNVVSRKGILPTIWKSFAASHFIALCRGSFSFVKSLLFCSIMGLEGDGREQCKRHDLWSQKILGLSMALPSASCRPVMLASVSLSVRTDHLVVMSCVVVEVLGLDDECMSRILNSFDS